MLVKKIVHGIRQTDLLKQKYEKQLEVGRRNTRDTSLELLHQEHRTDAKFRLDMATVAHRID